MDWRAPIVNRWTLTLGGLAIAVAAWNLYVSLNDDGILVGRVVGPDGRPVAGAAVGLWQQKFVSMALVAETATDEGGGFRFAGHGQHYPFLKAEKAGLGESARVGVRLYFRDQNRVLDEPLRLGPP